jgi:putative restriction endonuclease
MAFMDIPPTTDPNGKTVGLYLPIYPVWLAAEEPRQSQFVVSLDEDSLRVRNDLGIADPALVRSYAERVVKQRLHQPMFRQRVLLLQEPVKHLPPPA